MATPWLRVGQDGGRVELFVHLDVDVKQTNCSVMKWVKWEITSNRRSQTSTTKCSHSHLSSLVFFLRLPCCCSSSEVLSKEWLQSMSNKTFVQFDFFFYTVTNVFFSTTSLKEQENKATSAAGYNSLSSTHEFLQACSLCFPCQGKAVGRGNMLKQ